MRRSKLTKGLSTANRGPFEPIAIGVSIVGDNVRTVTLQGNYIYVPEGGGNEGSSLYQWYLNDIANPIPGETTDELEILADYIGNRIIFGVKPVGEFLESPIYFYSSPTEIIEDTPQVENVVIVGNAVQGETLGVDYDYIQNGGGPEDDTAYQWYRSDSNTGTNEVAISGATSNSYIVSLADANKFLRVKVTPSDGTYIGYEQYSLYTSPVLKVMIVAVARPTGTDLILGRYKFNGTDFVALQSDNTLGGTNGAIPVLAMSGVSTGIVFQPSVGSGQIAAVSNNNPWVFEGTTLSGLSATGWITNIETNTRAIALANEFSDVLQKYTFNGSIWATSGNALSLTGLSGASVCNLGANTIALHRCDTDTLTVYSFNGTDWAQVGNSLSIAGTTRCVLASLSANKIAMINDSDNTLKYISWDGSDFTVEASTSIFTVGTGSIGITALNHFMVAISRNNSVQNLLVYAYNDNEESAGWSQVGNVLANSPAYRTVACSSFGLHTGYA